MNAPNTQEQLLSDGSVDLPPPEPPHMIVRVTSIALRMIFPFMAQQDIRYYMNGINIRPLEDGGAMLIATDGRRFVVVRDPNGFAESEIIVAVSKDMIRHATNVKYTLDVMSNGTAVISDEVAMPLFIQPGNSLIEGNFPRIERVASRIGYIEGISGAVNPHYLADALAIAKGQSGSIRFFDKDDDSPLMFALSGTGELECFGGIMKMRDSLYALPTWFPEPGEVNTLDDI
jgi:DNA polymerase III sliding clamp (beta) subunit (PCNA family)